MTENGPIVNDKKITEYFTISMRTVTPDNIKPKPIARNIVMTLDEIYLIQKPVLFHDQALEKKAVIVIIKVTQTIRINYPQVNEFLGLESSQITLYQRGVAEVSYDE